MKISFSPARNAKKNFGRAKKIAYFLLHRKIITVRRISLRRKAKFSNPKLHALFKAFLPHYQAYNMHKSFKTFFGKTIFNTKI
jgi:hypothetical protein